MYKNIGKKLKTLASVVGLGGSGLSLLIGIIIAFSACSGGGRGYYQGYSHDVGNGVMWFFIFMGIAVVCFISSWGLYGFGQLIESTQNIESKLMGQTPNMPVDNRPMPYNKQAKNNTNTKLCPSCGTLIPKESKFCVKCGTKIDE